MRSFKIYGIWPQTNKQTDIHTTSAIAVTLVWGSLRLAPINLVGVDLVAKIYVMHKTHTIVPLVNKNFCAKCGCTPLPHPIENSDPLTSKVIMTVVQQLT